MGTSRAAIAFAIVSTIAWMCFVASYGVDRSHVLGDLKRFRFESTDFVYWSLSLIGIPGVILLLIYACTLRKAVGVTALLLQFFMMICAGGVMNTTGSQIADCLEKASLDHCIISPLKNASDTDGIHRYVQGEFAGSLMYAIFTSVAICVFSFRAHGARSNRYTPMS